MSTCRAVLTFTCLLLAMAGSNVHAQGHGLNSRRGFTLGLDLGGGGFQAANIHKGGFLGGLRVGGGVSENLVLTVEIAMALISEGSTDLALFSFLGSGQLYVLENLYGRLGLGVGQLDLTGNVAPGTTVTLTSDEGFSGLLAAGYELRLGKSFYVSPELRYLYARIEGVNVHAYGFTANLGWHF